MSAEVESRLADRRVTEWFRRESGRKEGSTSREPAFETRSVITISRQFGAGGHTVAESLKARLGEPWQIWDKAIIEKVADSAKVRTEMVAALDEHAQSWLDEMLRISLGRDVMEPATYRRHLTQVLLVLAHQGHVITVGRGANFVLPDALNVRLQASLKHRIQTTMVREGLTHDEAARRVREVDHHREEFTRSVFGREIEDASAYDMVIQTDTLGMDATIAAIVAAAECCRKAPAARK
ncbi:MAG TPA: cytidylate kinase-like family protein [Armatimonadota bacterium]|jgi:hypothetical protein